MKTQLHKFPFWFAAVLLALFIPACSEPAKKVDVQAQINLLKTGDENAKQDALVKLGEAKENAAPAIDLQIYEARSQEGTGRQARMRPIGGNLAPGPKSNNAAVPNQHGGFGMPAVTVKNSVRQDGMSVGI